VKYKLVIFDFDGTLADTLPWFTRVINKVAEKFNFKRIAPEEKETLRGYDANRMRKHLGVPLWKMPLIANHMHSLMAGDIRDIALFEGVDHLLQCLSGRGILLAVVSSNSSDNVRQLLGPANTALISDFECGVSVFGKQSKLRAILSKTGAAPAETIYVGDEIRDIEAAQSVDIAFGAVAWGYNTLEALTVHSPDEVFASIDDLIRILGE